MISEGLVAPRVVSCAPWERVVCKDPEGLSSLNMGCVGGFYMRNRNYGLE